MAIILNFCNDKWYRLFRTGTENHNSSAVNLRKLKQVNDDFLLTVVGKRLKSWRLTDITTTRHKSSLSFITSENEPGITVCQLCSKSVCIFVVTWPMTSPGLVPGAWFFYYFPRICKEESVITRM